MSRRHETTLTLVRCSSLLPSTYLIYNQCVYHTILMVAIFGRDATVLQMLITMYCTYGIVIVQ